MSACTSAKDEPQKAEKDGKFVLGIDGLPQQEDVTGLKAKVDELKAKFPNKHILIGEIGWPADGPWRRGAEASQVHQAKVIRNFQNIL